MLKEAFLIAWLATSISVGQAAAGIAPLERKSCQELFFTNQVDHFTWHRRSDHIPSTWRQRYFLDKSMWHKHTGPIFFYGKPVLEWFTEPKPECSQQQHQICNNFT